MLASYLKIALPHDRGGDQALLRVTQYVQNRYDQAKENRNITFAIVIVQRRLTSIVYAILSSLQRRRDQA